jgi:glutamine amidotransferase
VCRLVAYQGEPLALSTLVFGGSHTLARQSWAPRELLHGVVNVDGYGVAWRGPPGTARLARAEPIWHDPDLEAVLNAVRAPLAVAALRSASPGLPVSPDAVPPLILGPRIFALNGFVPNFRARHMRALRARLPDSLYAELRGVSDTETLFFLAVEALDGGASPDEALTHVVRVALEAVGAGGDECQLTMVLASDDGLAFCRTSNRETVNSLYRRDGGSLAPDGTLLASEALDEDGGWAPVPPHRVVSLTRGVETTKALR